MNLVSRFTVVRRLSFNNKRKKKQRFIPFNAIIFVSDGLRILLLKGEMSKTFEMRSVGNRMCIRWVCIRMMQKRRKKTKCNSWAILHFLLYPKEIYWTDKKAAKHEKDYYISCINKYRSANVLRKKKTEIYSQTLRKRNRRRDTRLRKPKMRHALRYSMQPQFQLTCILLVGQHLLIC